MRLKRLLDEKDKDHDAHDYQRELAKLNGIHWPPWEVKTLPSSAKKPKTAGTKSKKTSASEPSTGKSSKQKAPAGSASKGGNTLAELRTSLASKTKTATQALEQGPPAAKKQKVQSTSPASHRQAHPPLSGEHRSPVSRRLSELMAQQANHLHVPAQHQAIPVPQHQGFPSPQPKTHMNTFDMNEQFGFRFFKETKKNLVKNKYPHYTYTEIDNVLAHLWANLREEERQKINESALRQAMNQI